MEKDCESSSGNTATSSSSRQNPSDQYLKHLNRTSQKISKPPIATTKAPLRYQPPPAPQQPAVYKIDKTEFKDVVQRLTGSASSAPAQSPTPSSSRLQRIRPPPLTSLANTSTQTVNSTSESLISSYMRYLQSSTPNPTQNPVFPSPNFAVPNRQNGAVFPSSTFMMPNSPSGLGQILSPRSPQYPLLSPSLFLSPRSGQWGFPQFPQSPWLSGLSPR